jgi:hypothetical protein
MKSTRTKIMLGLGVAILAFFNYTIYQKEKLKRKSEIIFLQIAATQYKEESLSLSYTLVEPIPRESYESVDEPESLNESVSVVSESESVVDKSPTVTLLIKDEGYIVIRVDANHEGHFVRFYKNETLAPNERRLAYKLDYSFADSKYKPLFYIKILPNTFLVEKNKVAAYQTAKYAILKLDGLNRQCSLIGIAGADFKQIKIDESAASSQPQHLSDT